MRGVSGLDGIRHYGRCTYGTTRPERKGFEEGARNTVSTRRTLGYARKANLLRHLCGGRLHKWLAYWRRGRERELIPWAGWPASRLILAPFETANCLLPYTDRVMMDTIMWRVRCSAALWRLWWARRKWDYFQTRFARSASSWTTRSSRSSNLAGRYGKPGAGKLRGSRARSEKPRPKRSWRHCLGRGSAF